jgi:hypothetical protein
LAQTLALIGFYLFFALGAFFVVMLATDGIRRTMVRDGVRTLFFALIFSFGGYGEESGFVPIPLWSVFVILPPEYWWRNTAYIALFWLLSFAVVTAARRAARSLKATEDV